MNKLPYFVSAALLAFAANLFAHGDVVPQVVKTDGLPPLGDKPLEVNPYRGNKKAQPLAVSVGASAYNQNCARCHGLGAVSGGIAPDLRYLPEGREGDEYFQMRVRNGVVRNGVTYMPPFGSVFKEEAVWALRSYLEAVRVKE